MAAELLAAGHLYESYSTTEDVTARHLAAGRDPKLGYDNYDRTPDPALIAAATAAGRRAGAAAADAGPGHHLRRPGPRRASPSRPAACRTRCWSAAPGSRSTRWSIPVDDALMGITHVLRGEDLLPSTPRQIALYEALIDIGRADGRSASSGTCRSSPARATASSPSGIRSRTCSSTATTASSPRAWSTTWPCSAGRSARTGTSSPRPSWSPPSTAPGSPATRAVRPARRPRRSTARTCGCSTADDFAAPAGALPGRPRRPAGRAVRRAAARWSRAAAPLVQERSALLSDAAAMIDFLFVDAERFAIDPDAAAQGAHARGGAGAARPRSASPTRSARSPRQRLETGAEGGAGRRARPQAASVAFAPVRVAVTGRTMSPPLYESMELLGRDTSLARAAGGARARPGGDRAASHRSVGRLCREIVVGARIDRKECHWGMV